MIGDQVDFTARLKAVLPSNWFADETPVLDALLGSLATAWALVYSLLQYVRAQCRIGSATDIWLDIIAFDFFGQALSRKDGESDDSLRGRIKAELFRERGTRNGLVLALTELTGRPPRVFEPAHSTDTGGYGSTSGVSGGVAYGAAGGWGNLSLPFQYFVIAYRPVGGGISEVAGWCMPTGAYCGGVSEYASLSMVDTQVTDLDIYSTVASVIPAATIAWTQISN